MGRNAELAKIMKIANAQNAPQPLKAGEKTTRKISRKASVKHRRSKK